MGKLVLKTALVTIVAIIVVLGLAVGGLIWFAPNIVASATEKLGINSISLIMYERCYKKDNNIESLYTLVNKSIQFQDNEMLIKYYPTLEEHKDYNEYMTALDAANYNKDQSILLNLKLANEDNRLKTRYVQALSKKDFKKAFDYAVEDLSRVDASANKLNFCIVGLVDGISVNNINLFEQDIDAISASVVDKVYSLYVDVKNVHATNTGDTYEKALRASKLIDMIQFMLLIDSKTEGNSYDEDALSNDLAEIFAEYKEYIK